MYSPAAVYAAVAKFLARVIRVGRDPAMKKSEARYVVLTSKHHEGFTLWPSTTPNPNPSLKPSQLHAERDKLLRQIGISGVDASAPAVVDLDCPALDMPVAGQRSSKFIVNRALPDAQIANAPQCLR